MDWDPSDNSLSQSTYVLLFDQTLNYDWLEFNKVKLNIIIVLSLFFITKHSAYCK